MGRILPGPIPGFYDFVITLLLDRVSQLCEVVTAILRTVIIGDSSDIPCSRDHEK